MGNPVAHSLSPKIHSLFAAQTGESIHYQSILVGLDDFSPALLRFRDRGGKGLNITVPFKLEACATCDHLSDRASRAAAVNTIWFDAQGKVHGDNTDGVGLVTDITENQGIPIRGRQVLVLGAGGAVQGILGPILEQAPGRLVIANRTVARARALREKFTGAEQLSACGFVELRGESFDIVINGTAASLDAEVPDIPEDIFSPGALSYDLMYSSSATAFQAWSREHGAAACLDGLGMLVEQAAEAFYLWRDVMPQTAAVIKELRGGK